uniref:Uncharacterized protein n=1 Tax=Heterorhabditis bacteriophora TaxID=37862 RepID=A0A1I7XF90_HETBA
MLTVDQSHKTNSSSMHINSVNINGPT